MRKGRILEKWILEEGLKTKKFYTHEDSDGLSNGEEGEFDQEYQLLIEFADKGINVSDGVFMDAL